jgi:hypothetical protein
VNLLKAGLTIGPVSLQGRLVSVCGSTGVYTVTGKPQCSSKLSAQSDGALAPVTKDPGLCPSGYTFDKGSTGVVDSWAKCTGTKGCQNDNTGCEKGSTNDSAVLANFTVTIGPVNSKVSIMDVETNGMTQDTYVGASWTMVSCTKGTDSVFSYDSSKATQATFTSCIDNGIPCKPTAPPAPPPPPSK